MIFQNGEQLSGKFQLKKNTVALNVLSSCIPGKSGAYKNHAELLCVRLQNVIRF